MRGEQNRIKLLFGGLAALAAGLVLIVLLVWATPLRPHDVLRAVRKAQPPFLVLIILSTLFHFWITAYKWRLVTKVLLQETFLKINFFLYSAFIALLAQVLPMQMSVMTVRTLALCLHQRMPLLKGAASVLYDQFFDLLIPLILLVPALLAMLGILGTSQGVILSGILLVATGAVVTRLGNRTASLTLAATGKLPFARRLLERAAPNGFVEQEIALFQRPVVARLFAASAVRYANLLLRSYLVVLAVGMDIDFASVAYAMPVVMLSIVISVTPASLGIAEWGWVGVLAAFGVSSAQGAEFALLNRILVLAAVVITNALIFLVVFLRRRQT